MEGQVADRDTPQLNHVAGISRSDLYVPGPVEKCS